MTTTDFEIWLSSVSLDNHEEAYSLYQSVLEVEDNGIFSCKENQGKYFVSVGHVDETLMLASEKAREHFLRCIEKQEGMDEFGGLEGWYGYKHAMSKDD